MVAKGWTSLPQGLLASRLKGRWGCRLMDLLPNAPVTIQFIRTRGDGVERVSQKIGIVIDSNAFPRSIL